MGDTSPPIDVRPIHMGGIQDAIVIPTVRRTCQGLHAYRPHKFDSTEGIDHNTVHIR